MPKYGVYFDDHTTSTSNTTAVLIYANATGERGEIIELIMTGSGITVAADTQHRALVLRQDCGSTGTMTAVTAVKFHDKSAAATLLSQIEATAEPTTYVADSALLWGFNQRGGMRWAVPQGEGVYLQNADTNDAVGFLVRSSAAGKVDGSVNWWEP